MKRLGEVAWNTLIVLAIVGWLAFLWFAADWFSTPGCDANSDPVHCGQVSGPGPGNGH
jgi:hypothetical protein